MAAGTPGAAAAHADLPGCRVTAGAGFLDEGAAGVEVYHQGPVQHSVWEHLPHLSQPHLLLKVPHALL